MKTALTATGAYRRRVVVRWCVLPIVLLACAGTASGLEPITLRSRSGQFIVYGLPVGQLPASSTPVLTNSFIRLDPAVMAVSCERIKDAVLAELAAPDAWRDTLTIYLRPVRHHEEPIEIVSTRFKDGWNYRLHAPDYVARTKLLKATVQVLLLEMAQRNSSTQPAELPPWLVPGLAACIESTTIAGLALEPHTSTVVQGRRREPLSSPREILREQRPLTIDQMSWPTADQLAAEDGGVYRACSHLLVRGLLRFSDGAQCLRETIGQLALHLNWQTAFLRGFQSHFRRMVDVEKWWALTTTHFTGVGTMSLWTPEQTLAQLDEALIAEVQVREGTNSLPRLDRLTLQQVLTNTRLPQREALLQARIQLLDVVRLRAAVGLAPMVEAYRAALQDYLRAPRMTYSREQPSTPRKLSLKEAVTRLDGLDNDREALRRQLGFTLTEALPGTTNSR
jgi:hypothetical protein